MKNLKKTDKGLFIRQDRADGLISDVARYASNINRKSMPLLCELGMNSDVSKILRYCSTGGLERLRKEYAAQFPEGSAFRRVALAQFAFVSEKHPEFREVANTWKFARLLRVDENGLLAVDKDACRARRAVYVTTPEGVAFVNSLGKLVDQINELFPDNLQQPFGVLQSLLTFNTETKRFEINTATISDTYISRILEPSRGFFEDKRKRTREANERRTAEREQLKAQLEGQGMTGDEIDAIIDADRDLKLFNEK